MSSFATILAVSELSRLLTGYLEPDVLLCKQVQLSKPSLLQRARALGGSLRRSRMQNRKLEDDLQAEIYRRQTLALTKERLARELDLAARELEISHTMYEAELARVNGLRSRELDLATRQLDLAARELAIANEHREIAQTRYEVIRDHR